MKGNDINNIAKTRRAQNHLKWMQFAPKLHKRHKKSNVEVSEVYFCINSFTLAYIRLK